MKELERRVVVIILIALVITMILTGVSACKEEKKRIVSYVEDSEQEENYDTIDILTGEICDSSEGLEGST
jgi:hypothetical protein